MALYIPHICPKFFESVTLIQLQDKGGVGLQRAKSPENVPTDQDRKRGKP